MSLKPFLEFGPRVSRDQVHQKSFLGEVMYNETLFVFL